MTALEIYKIVICLAVAALQVLNIRQELNFKSACELAILVSIDGSEAHFSSEFFARLREGWHH